MVSIVHVPEFEKDLAHMQKFRGFDEDLDRFKTALLQEWPKLLNGAVIISNLGEEYLPAFKARKFRCKALNKGTRSGIRIIYTHNPKTDEILFIELMFKGDSDNHDRDRLRKYLIRKDSLN